MEKEREKYAKVSDTTEVIATEPPFKVNTSQLLDPDAAAYKFTVEIPLPIDVVVLQSQIPVDLLDVDSNVAIISKTAPDRWVCLRTALLRVLLRRPVHGSSCQRVALLMSFWLSPQPVHVTAYHAMCCSCCCVCGRVSKSLLLATYRCQESVSRLEIAARTVEGQYGDVQMTVIANVSPGKTGQIVKFAIKPLSLHFRCAEGVVFRERGCGVLSVVASKCCCLRPQRPRRAG